jgi:hypothetical protein
MNLKTQHLKFGDLLVKLQLVNQQDLADALQVAPQFGLPLGRTLVLSGRLSEAELQLAVELQPMINNKGYPIEQAIKAALLVRANSLSPEEAFKQVGVTSSSDKAILGSMLMEAGAITQQQLDDAQKVSYETGMRLGRVLVLNNVISHALLTRALGLQTMVRDRRISLPQAVDLLCAEVVPKQIPLPLSLESQSARPAPAKKQVRLHEFLVMSGVATETEMLNAMETSLSKQQSLGEAIVELGLVSSRVFDKAVQLHDKVCVGDIQLNQATDEIHRMVFGDPNQHNNSNTKPSEGGAPPPVLGELLKMTGLVNDSDISEAIELSNKYPSLIGKMLVVSGAIDEATLIASLRCQYLLKHGYLSIDDAVQALQYTKKNKVSFDDALEELGIRKLSVQ